MPSEKSRRYSASRVESRKYPNDARLWAKLSGLFYEAGATSPEDRGRFARRAVAVVRRERATGPEPLPTYYAPEIASEENP